jgi:hypothetical protein
MPASAFLLDLHAAAGCPDATLVRAAAHAAFPAFEGSIIHISMAMPTQASQCAFHDRRACMPAGRGRRPIIPELKAQAPSQFATRGLTLAG